MGDVMRRSFFDMIAALGCVSVMALAVPGAVHAQDRGSIVRGGPAPLIGVGLPLVGGVLAAVLLARRLRRKD
jgi:hypothetical protein